MILALEKAKGGQILVLGELTDLGGVMLCKKKSQHESCKIGRHIVVMKLICSLSHCKCEGHTVHQLS
jgi:hypothetical protein